MPRILLALLLALLAGATWWLWPGGPTDGGGSPGSSPAPAAGSPSPTLATGDEPTRRPAPAPPSGGDGGDRTVRGRVELPIGVGGDAIEVLALPVEGGAVDAVERLFALRDGGAGAGRAGGRSRPVGPDGPVARATTDAEGRFRLELPPGVDLVRLLAIGPRCWSMLPTLAAVGETDARVACRLGGRLVGRVVGLPPGAAARVRLDLARAAATRAPSGQMTRGRTVPVDADGGFALDAVPLLEGLRLRVLGPGGDPSPTPVSLLTAGEERAVELALEPGVLVAGRVIDPAGRPLADAEVAAFEREPFGLPGTRLREARTDADGRFELPHLVTTDAVGQVSADGFRTRRFALRGPAVGGRVDLGALELSRGAALAGRVRLPDGRPAPGARVEVTLDLQQGRAEQAEVVWSGSEGAAETDAEGAFRVAGLEGDVFEVDASLEFDGRLLRARRVGVREGDELVLELAETLTLAGRVRSTEGEPVEAFALRIARERPNPLRARAADERAVGLRDAQGRFALDGLLRGRWVLSIEAPGHATPPPLDLELPLDAPLEIELEPSRAVVGTVVDPEGRPLAGALVRLDDPWFAVLRDGARSATLSDAEGRFELSGVGTGEFALVAEHERYVQSEPVTVTLADGAAAPNPRLALRTGGTLRGRAWNRDGAPIAGGRLMLIELVRFRPSLFELGPDGRFELRRVVPGSYQVLAIPDLSGAMTDGRDDSLTARLLGESESEVVQVADGELVEVELGRPLIDPVRVTGRVTQGGRPAARHFLGFIAEGRGLADEVRAQTDGEGRFEVVLREPGPHLVTVTRGLPPAADQATLEFRRDVPAGAEARLDLELPETAVTGRVSDPDGRPLAGVGVHAQRADGIAHGSPLGGATATAVTDADGRYRLDLLEPGRYHLRAGGPAPVLTTGTEPGWGAVLRSDVELAEGETLEAVDFTLAPGAALAGRVVDAAGRPVPDATVFVRDAEGRPVGRISARVSDPSGRFTVDGLGPGPHSLLARRGELASPEVGPLGAGEGAEVELRLGPGTLLIARVEVDGEPDPGARLRVLDASDRDLSGLIALNDVLRDLSDGFQADEFRVGPLPPGRYRVVARAADGREQERAVELTGQPERRLRLRVD